MGRWGSAAVVGVVLVALVAAVTSTPGRTWESVNVGNTVIKEIASQLRPRDSDIPPDWRAGVEQGNLLFSVSDPQEGYRMVNIRLCMNLSLIVIAQASIGNGYVATIVNSPDMYVSGVFNGAESKSVRARVPATTAITVAGATSYASALDIHKGNPKRFH